MALPQNVNILGINFEVLEVEVVNKEIPRKGEIDFLKNVIKVDESMPADSKEQVLIHEILHGILDLLGLDEINENEYAVQSIATAIHHVFKSNVIISS